MKVAALGRTQWLHDSIAAVAEQGHDVVLVGTSPAAPEYTVNQEHFAQLANQLGARYFCDVAINRPEYRKMAEESGAEVAISVNCSTIIGPALLRQFRHGIINAHAGDLPRFRGNAAPNWAILTGESKVVLTLHRMTDELDAGPILLQRACPLLEDTYISDVYDFLARNVPDMFVEVLNGLSDGTLVGRPQSEVPQDALRCYPRLPEDGQIDWRLPASQLARLVRASAEPFAGAYTYLAGLKLIVWRARAAELPHKHLGVPGQVLAVQRQSGEVAVLAGEGALILEVVEVGDAVRTSAAHVVTSVRVRLGMDVEREIGRLQGQLADLRSQLGHVLTSGRRE